MTCTRAWSFFCETVPCQTSSSWEVCSLESRIQVMVFNGENAASVNGRPGRRPDLAKAVRAAQSTSTSARLTPWQKYCLAPPKELLRLRSLVARGRARERKRLRSRETRAKAAPLRAVVSERAVRRETVIAFWNP